MVDSAAWWKTGYGSDRWIMPYGTSSKDLGFGPAYWISSVRFGDNAGAFKYETSSTEQQGFCMVEWGHCEDEADDYRTLKYRKTSTGSNYTYTIPKNGSPVIFEAANQALSQAFNKPIYIIKPEFPLYTFLDSGSATFALGFAKNGKDYEGVDAIPNSISSIPTWFSQTSGSATVELRIKRSGVVVQTWNIKTTTEKTLNYYTYDVKPGDEVILATDQKANGGVAGCYSIFYFCYNIPGWKIADIT